MNANIATVDALTKHALEVAIHAAKAGGERILHFFKEGSYQVQTKKDTSLQTTGDISAEAAILQELHSAFPDHNISSEEQGFFSPTTSSAYSWNVDPLDGTENFVLNIPYFSSSIALYAHQKIVLAVVYNPITGDLFTAIRGQGAFLNGNPLLLSQQKDLHKSRVFFIPDFVTKQQPATIRLRELLYHSCRRVLDTWSPALDWCLVASGKVDFIVSIIDGPLLADESAGKLILEEAGGKVTGYLFAPAPHKKISVLVGSSATSLHEQALQLIEKAHDQDNKRASD